MRTEASALGLLKLPACQDLSQCCGEVAGPLLICLACLSQGDRRKGGMLTSLVDALQFDGQRLFTCLYPTSKEVPRAKVGFRS